MIPGEQVITCNSASVGVGSAASTPGIRSAWSSISQWRRQNDPEDHAMRLDPSHAGLLHQHGLLNQKIRTKRISIDSNRLKTTPKYSYAPFDRAFCRKKLRHFPAWLFFDVGFKEGMASPKIVLGTISPLAILITIRKSSRPNGSSENAGV